MLVDSAACFPKISLAMIDCEGNSLKNSDTIDGAYSYYNRFLACFISRGANFSRFTMLRLLQFLIHLVLSARFSPSLFERLYGNGFFVLRDAKIGTCTFGCVAFYCFTFFFINCGGTLIFRLTLLYVLCIRSF